MPSRADSHDADKLRRWRTDLSDSPSPTFPVSAMFLVSERDKAAHDVFRSFRTSFEDRGAGFGNLVIFGQHGVSTTVHAMLQQLGLAAEALPVLALWQGSEFPQVCHLPLPAGEAGQDSRSLPDPSDLLGRVEELASGLENQSPTSGIPGTTTASVADRDVLSWVSGLADVVETAG